MATSPVPSNENSLRLCKHYRSQECPQCEIERLRAVLDKTEAARLRLQRLVDASGIGQSPFETTAQERLDSWYETEAKIRTALVEIVGEDVYLRAINKIGADAAKHNPRFAQETSAPCCPWCGGKHVGTDCKAEKANAEVRANAGVSPASPAEEVPVAVGSVLKASAPLYGGKVRLSCGCIDICTNQRDHKPLAQNGKAESITLCAAPGPSGFICERPVGHNGRHCDGDNRRW